MELEAIGRNCAVLVHKIQELQSGTASARQVNLGTMGIPLVGVVRDVWPQGLVAYSYDTPASWDELKMMVRYLALVSIKEGFSGSAHLVGWSNEKRGEGPVLRELRLADLKESSRVLTARTLLKKMVSWYRLGQTRPLPFFPRTSRAFADVLSKAVDPETAVDAAINKARQAWRSWREDAWHGEGLDANIRRVWGEELPIDDVTGAGGPLPDGYDFKTLAKEIWTPFQRVLIDEEEQ